MEQIAKPFEMSLTASSRIFNVTDELVRTSKSHPQYTRNFLNLNHMLVDQAMQALLMSVNDSSKRETFLINQLGITVNSFNSLQVYHYIRMRKNEESTGAEYEQKLRDELVAAASNYFQQVKFVGNYRKDQEENFKILSFVPVTKGNFRVDHLFQLIEQRQPSQQFCVDWAFAL